MAGPEIGSVHDGFRFKGGDPNQEASWEQVAPVSAPEYGQGAQRLPNGDVVRYGPRGGVTVLQRAGNGGSQLAGADARTRLTLGLGPIYQAQERLGQIEAQHGNVFNREWGARALEAVPFDGGVAARVFGGPDYRAYEQASRTFEASMMPIFSGAAVTESEAKRFIRANLPQMGDSPEILAEKARNRQMMINAAARLTGEEMPYPDVGVFGALNRQDENNQPRREGIGAPARSSAEAPPPPVGGVGPSDPNAPQPGETRVYSQPLSEDDTPESLRAQGYVYDPERDTWSRTRREQAPTPEDRGWTPESAVAQRRSMDESFLGSLGRRADAFARGLGDTASLEWADELAAAADARFGQGVGDDFGARYSNNLQVQRALDRADRADVPAWRLAGQTAGATVPAIGMLGTATRLGRPVVNALRLAAGGAAGGAVAGAGGGDGWGRVPSALVGGAIGSVVAPVAGAVAGPAVNALQGVNRFVGRQIGRAGEQLGVPGASALTNRATPSALDVAVDRFAERQRPDVSALRARDEQLRSMEIEPTFADLTDDAGRGVLRAAATRQTPARQAAREFADQRAEGLQDRVSFQARRTISDDPRTPDQIRSEIANRRAREGDAAFGAVRNEILTPEPQIIEALRTPAGRSAVNDAATRASNRGDIETANMLRQLADDALDNPSDVRMTVGMADRIARTLNGLGEARRGTITAPGDNDAASSFFSLAEALRGTARRQVPGYDEALRAFGDDSRLIEAAGLGERFLSQEADQFGAAAARLSPDERQVARAAARRAVEREAGTQGRAPGVAQRLAGGREQAQRSAALLGDAQPMQEAMRAERDLLMAAREVSPATGSATARNLQDAASLAGDVTGAARDLVTGNLPGFLTRAIRRFQSRGFSDREAEALVLAAIDPARTQEVIDQLAKRMSRREARNSVRTIRRLSVQGGATAPQRE